MMKVNTPKNNSLKIKHLQSIAILMVLYIHGVYLEANADYCVAQYIQGLFGFSGLSFIANPLFFIISGYLFFLGVERCKECYPKMKKRAKTLLVPYLIWNVIFVLWYVVLALLPGVSQFVNSDILGGLSQGGFWGGLKTLFVNPISFPLWFLRDLMIYVLLSPLIYWGLKHLRWALPVVLFVMATVGLFVLPSEIKLWGTFFFVLGGYVAQFSSLEKIAETIKMPVVIICLLVYLANAIIRPMNVVSLKGTDVFVELCGVVAVWRLYDGVVKKHGDNKCFALLTTLSGYSFFIYLFHEPALNIIKKLGLSVLGLGEWQLIVLYLVNPFIMCVFAILVAKLLQKLMPKVYSVLVGGR